MLPFLLIIKHLIIRRALTIENKCNFCPMKRTEYVKRSVGVGFIAR